jgi:zinc transport system ATP-binding protein
MSQNIEVKQLGVCQQGRWIIKDISLTIAPGEIVTLIGPNGCGKTTLVRALLGLLPFSAGSIDMPDKLTIGYMPQVCHIEPTLPITVQRFLRLSGAALDAGLNEKLRIEHLLKQSMQVLSGGEMQRVLMARALMRKPKLLVLDEPVQGVDITGQSKLYDLITEVRDELGCSVLMVSHDLHVVMAKTDKVICLNQHICCSGTPEAVQQDPAYLHLFGSHAEKLAVYTHDHDHDHDGANRV